MCGIFGYAGSADASLAVVCGLERLEYRGYDSWGVAVHDGSSLAVRKAVGAVDPSAKAQLLAELSGGILAIGHTRWATHGAISLENAHPQCAADGSFALVHNGVIENYRELRRELAASGCCFTSETDTEVLVRLVERLLAGVERSPAALREALRTAFARLEGRNSVLLLSREPSVLIATRVGSPLVLGTRGKEWFFASDALSFADCTRDVVFIEDYEIAEHYQGRLSVYAPGGAAVEQLRRSQILAEQQCISREGHPHFMLKEILEQARTIEAAVQLDPTLLERAAGLVRDARAVYATGAGGALFTAEQIAFFLRAAGVIAHALPAYEERGYIPLVGREDVLIAVSQSGETADTLELVHAARARGTSLISVVNMPASSLERLADVHVASRAGPEVCVLSTKSATAQIAFGYELSGRLQGRQAQTHADIARLAACLQQGDYFTVAAEAARRVAERLRDAAGTFVLGSGASFHPARITALNIKEASYVHAEAFSAGELKHGVIALIEPGTPVICFVPEGPDQKQLLTAAAEVKARGAFLIGIGEQKDELFDAFLPLPQCGPAGVIAYIIPGQLLAYYLAVARGSNPDRPRNLAKSITVR